MNAFTIGTFTAPFLGTLLLAGAVVAKPFECRLMFQNRGPSAFELMSRARAGDQAASLALKAAPGLFGVRPPSRAELLSELRTQAPDRTPRGLIDEHQAREGAQLIFNSWDTGALIGSRADILGRLVLPRLFVATHQSSALQAKTAALLGATSLRSTPRLSLVDPLHPANDSGFAQAASLLQLSRAGEIHSPVSAQEVFLVGGFVNACLAQTIEQMVLSALRNGQREIEMRIFTDLVYELNLRSQREVIDLILENQIFNRRPLPVGGLSGHAYEATVETPGRSIRVRLNFESSEEYLHREDAQL